MEARADDDDTIAQWLCELAGARETQARNERELAARIRFLGFVACRDAFANVERSSALLSRLATLTYHL